MMTIGKVNYHVGMFLAKFRLIKLFRVCGIFIKREEVTPEEVTSPAFAGCKLVQIRSPGVRFFVYDALNPLLPPEFLMYSGIAPVSKGTEVVLV